MAATAQSQSEEVAVEIKANATVHNREIGTDESVLFEDTRTPHAPQAPSTMNIAIRPNAPLDLPVLLSRVSKLGASYAQNEDEDIRAEYLDAGPPSRLFSRDSS